MAPEPPPSERARLGWAAPLLDWPAARWSGGAPEPGTEPLIEETPIALVYNGQHHVVMMATPQDLDDFILGFSLTEGLIESADQLEAVEIVRYSRGIELQARVPAERQAVIEGRNRRMSGRTGCGICGSDSIDSVVRTLPPVGGGGRFSPGAVLHGVEAVASRQPLNHAAGTVHAAAWVAPDGSIGLVREDVGRHNALDKLIGALARRGTGPQSGFVVVTSRASFEMVQKAAAFGAPALVAVSGVTGLAARLAKETGLTLIGFARPGRFTVYTHPERLESE